MISTEYVYDRLKYHLKANELSADGDEDNIESDVHGWSIRHTSYPGKLVALLYYVNDGRIICGASNEVSINGPNFDDRVRKLFDDVVWYLKKEYYNIDC
jgi:hypothetical protein